MELLESRVALFMFASFVVALFCLVWSRATTSRSESCGFQIRFRSPRCVPEDPLFDHPRNSAVKAVAPVGMVEWKPYDLAGRLQYEQAPNHKPKLHLTDTARDIIQSMNYGQLRRPNKAKYIGFLLLQPCLGRTPLPDTGPTAGGCFCVSNLGFSLSWHAASIGPSQEA